jgi:hypothetical protein
MATTDDTTESDALHARVRAEIENAGPLPEAFDALALTIAAFQVRRVEPLARLVRAKGLDIASLRSIDEVPAIPCDVFRLKRVSAHAPSLDTRVFRTSGTTLGTRGAHFFRDLCTYETAAMAFASRMLWPDAKPASVISLAPSSTEVRDSSLGFMIDLFAERLSVPITHAFSAGPGLDIGALRAAVEHASAPVLVAGTAFAYVALLDDESPTVLRLPAGSRVMLTGGFKGRSREIAEVELRALLAARFGVSQRDVVGEYGMTELSSQLYESESKSGVRRYRWPPWMRVSAVDPLSLEPVPPGEEGICRIVDLANVDSAVAIQTQDRVRISEDRVELLGRLPGATPRGCSLAIEEILLERGA